MKKITWALLLAVLALQGCVAGDQQPVKPLKTDVPIVAAQTIPYQAPKAPPEAVVASALDKIASPVAEVVSKATPYAGNQTIPNAAPDFTLAALDGRKITLSSYRTKQPVIMVFWTTRCKYCRVELMRLATLYPQLSREGIEILAIDLLESQAKVQNYVQLNKMPFPVLMDFSGVTLDAYKLLGVPSVVVVDRNGSLVYSGHEFPASRYKALIGLE